MTCAETRDLFSALADDALSPDERAALDAHLARCAECRRELASLLRTVKMVRALDPAQAPAGFVDRVLAAAQPEPRPMRLARRLSRPWPALPLSAAALLLVGGLAVLLFRASPEQQRAARYQPPAAPTPAVPPTPEPPTASAPPTSQPRTPSAPPTSQPPTASAPKSDTPPAPMSRTFELSKKEPSRNAAPPPPSTRPDQSGLRDRQPASPSPRAAEQAASSRVTEQPQTSQAANKADVRANANPPTREPAEQRVVAAAKPAERARAKADVSDRAESKDEATDNVAPAGSAAAPAPPAVAKTQSTPQSAPLSRTGPMTGIQAAPPDVTAQLRATNASTAERSLLDLATRVGGRQTGRRITGGRLIVELAVPRDAYAEFVRGVSTLGPVAIQTQATERPVLSISIAVSS
jgi:hypothetical protein